MVNSKDWSTELNKSDRNYPRYFYLFGLSCVLAGLSNSAFLMSLGQFILLAHFLFTGSFLQKLKGTQRSIYLPTLLLAALHLLSLIYTEDYKEALQDWTKKIPLYLIPLFIFTEKPISEKEKEGLLDVFQLGVLLTTFISAWVWLGWSSKKIHSGRDISIFISHIRFSLMCGFSLLICLIRNRACSIISARWLWSLHIIWLFTVQILLQSLSGLLITSLLALFHTFHQRLAMLPKLKWTLLSLCLSSLLLFLLYWHQSYQDFSRFQSYSPQTHSALKTPYVSNLNTQRENGYLVWDKIAPFEIDSAWSRRSAMPFTQRLDNQSDIKSTLFRYLSSKGLSKDAAGVNRLSDEEIRLIENGITNYKFPNKKKFGYRIYQLFCEFQNYQTQHNSNGNSLVMRLEYWETSWRIIKQNLWFGVGCGDVKSAFEKQYKTDKSLLHKDNRRLSHNQFLNQWISTGIIGVLVFLIFLFTPLLKAWKEKKLLFYFSLLITISMLNEDTLDTQAGITFYGIGIGILYFGNALYRKTK